jgi:hypothetical protein
MTVISKEAEDLAQRRREDFDFMVLCAAKGNMSMYQLLRDLSLDEPEKSAADIEYESWFKKGPEEQA